MFISRGYQQEAAEAVARELQIADRASLVMCCGSGKTYTGALIARFLDARNRVIVAPTIMLAEQIADEYRAIFPDPVLAFHSESGQYINLNPPGGPFTCVTTYHSAPELLCRLEEMGIVVDLLTYDEVHRTAGKFSALFNTTLKGYPCVRKRLGMTATPRHAALNEADDDTEFFSMDNNELYGKIAYTYQLRRAINDGVISDYKLLVACVTDAEVRDYLKGKTVADSDHKTYALALTLRQAMEQFGLRKIITYHATIDEASKSARIFRQVLDIPVTHVSSRQGTYTRDASFRVYRDSDACVITNARCLNEGMNVPDTDAVMFCSNKSSETDIIQCAGRAMRRDPGKDLGYIILPVLSGENALEYSDYAPIFQVLNSLSENDELLHQAIRLSHPDSKDLTHTLLPAFFRFTDNSKFDVQQLARQIYLKVYDSFNQSFFDRVEQLQEFINIHGHARVPTVKTGNLGYWVRHMRALHRKQALNPEKKAILDKLGFIWDVKDDLFWQNYEELAAWLKEGHSIEEASTGPFSGFIKRQRAAARDGILPDYQKQAMVSLGVYFDVKNHIFTQNLQLLKDVLTTHENVPRDSPLSDWVKYLRKKYRENTLTDEEIRQIEATGLRLSTADERHLSFVEKLNEFVRLYNELKKITPAMNSFRGTIRKQYRNNTLKEDRLQLILTAQEKLGIDILGIK